MSLGWGNHKKEDIASKLSALAAQQEERVARKRAERFGLPYISLTTFPMEPVVLRLIAKEKAEQLGAVMFYKKGQDIRIGVVNPDQEEFRELIKTVKDKLGVSPQVYVVSNHSLMVALSRYGKETGKELVAEGEMRITEDQLKEIEKSLADLKTLGEKISRVPTTELMSVLVAGAMKARASDIHIDPFKESARVRYRVDGVLQDVVEFRRESWKYILSRVKVLANLKLNVHDLPQEGSFVVRVDGEKYDVRLSVLPGGYGEHIVMRLFSRREGVYKLSDLGMKDWDLRVVKEELKESTGMILASGPTGSGKTTTVAACINEVSRPELKVISLEDPIEYRLVGVEQTEVDNDSGYTFAVGLRTILRQDPDIIFVGEMRDMETAETAIHASMSGHLVFSTIHSNNAVGVILRTADIGVRSYVLAPAINLIIAQRLVRKVCGKCGQRYKVDTRMREHIKQVMEGVREEVFDASVLDRRDLIFLKAVGCEECEGTGYKGRTGVYELFAVKGTIEELVLEGVDSQRIEEAARQQGMTTIAQDAYIKVIDQITTVEEVERVSEE